MRLLSSAVLLLVLISFIVLIGISAVLARSWSYHYHPEVLTPTPIATPAKVAPSTSEQSSTPMLLKRAIVSDLAIFARDRNLQPRTTSQLSLFDAMNSPEALIAFASLSGYYLGASAEELYKCQALRKGKALEPYLEQYVHGGNPQCLNDLGPDFSKPSPSLDGHALCFASDQVEKRVTDLIAEIDNGKSCADSDLAQIRGGERN